MGIVLRRGFTVLCLVLFLAPLTGSISNVEPTESKWSTSIPEMTPVIYVEVDWWDHTTLDTNRNGIHDSLESLEGPVGIGFFFVPNVDHQFYK